jgi:hypothetical protein
VGRGLVGIVWAALALGGAGSASAAVTIGQVVPAPVPCANNDWAQIAVASGTSYEVPVNGTIISWSHPAGPGAGQSMTMKVWRPVVFGSTYSVAAHDGPRNLTPSVTNVFPVRVPVKLGDVLGLNSAGDVSSCLSPITPGDAALGKVGDAQDGESVAFSGTFLRHLNITAVVEPTNTFSLGAVKRNKKKGTAAVRVELPNAGELVASGKGAKTSGDRAMISKAVSGPGTATLDIRAKGSKKKTLNDRGKVKLRVTVTYTPTGGTASVQPLTVTLKKV